MLNKIIRVSIIPVLVLAFPLITFGQSGKLSSAIEHDFYDNHFKMVISLFESLATTDSLTPNAIYLIGLSYTKILAPQKAIIMYKKAKQEGGSSTKIMYALGKAQETLGNLEAAEQIYQEIIRIDSTNLSVKLALSHLYMKMRQWESAIEQYKILVKLYPHNDILYAGLATCYKALGNNEKAKHYFEQAFEINTRNADVAMHLSGYYFNKELWINALQVVNKTLVYHPSSGRLWLRSADINFQQDSLKKAALQYKKVLQLDDTSAVVLRKLGTTFILLDRYKLALNALKKAYAINKNDPVTCFYLGIAYKNLGNLDASVAFLQKVVDQFGEGILIKTYRQLANTYDLKNNLPQALGAYKMALKINPDLKNIYFRLGVLYDKYYKDKSVAILYYQLFLKKSNTPNNQQQIVFFNLQQNVLKTYAQNRIKVLEKWVGNL